MQEKVTAENTLAVIIDMQTEEISVDTSNFCRRLQVESIVQHQLEMVHFCQEKGIPVYSVEMRGKGELIKPLRTQLYEYNRRRELKTTSSAFLSGNFPKILQRKGVKKILIMGVYASGCVHQTICDGKARRYTMLTAENLTSNPKGFDFPTDIKNMYQQAESILYTKTHEQLLEIIT